MTLTEYLDAIAEKLGVNGLPDRLLTTYLKAFAQNQGVDVSALPDNLTTTYLSAIRNARGGQPVQDNLITTHLAEIAKTYGLEELPSNMISAYLEAIAAVADSGGGSGDSGDSGDSGGGEPAELYSWEGVAYRINNGTYKDVYAIGDMVPLDLGSEGLINMQIAAFDADTLADGSGTAAISWVANEPMKTKKRMNPVGSNGQEGTGTYGGWEKSEMRTYLRNTVKPMIPQVTANQIVDVKKNQLAYDGSGSSFTQTTEDDLWLISPDECYGSIYHDLLGTNSSRIKNAQGSTTACSWWTRKAASTLSFKGVNTSGKYTDYRAETVYYYVVLGFCTGRTPT